MLTSDFDYELPPELVAQTPLEPRDSSRLLVMRRTGGALEHRRFSDITDYLRPGDLMVFNRSRVIPARLAGRRDDTGSPVELLLLRREAPRVWQALARPARRLRPGLTITVVPPPDRPKATPSAEEPRLEILESRQDGVKLVRFSSDEAIEEFGDTPLPPYIHQRLDDPERYQPVYARDPGSAASPTAGLHFTDGLLERIRDCGVETAFVTLHVGLDTFRPLQVDDPSEHRIHTEQYEIDASAALALNRAKRRGGRVVAVGTTSVRVLEQAAADAAAASTEEFRPVDGQAGIYILPGHRFRSVDAMVTNFHLPRTTLLMLAAAFAAEGVGGDPVQGRNNVLAAYQEAVRRRYRFYSFGDAMLLM